MSSAMRTRRTSSASSARFNRPGAATTGRFNRSGATNRRAAAASRRHVAQRRGVAGGWLQRGRPQKQSGVKRVMSSVSGALPSLGRKSSSSSSSRMGKGGKAGGLALLAGAVGLAVKNRDKVASMARRDHGEETQPTPPVTTTVPPAATGPSSPGMTQGTTPATDGGDSGDRPKL